MKKAILIIFSLITIVSVCAFTFDFTGTKIADYQIIFQNALVDDGDIPEFTTQNIYHVGFRGNSDFISAGTYMADGGELISIIAEHSIVVDGTTYYFSYWAGTSSTTRRLCIYPSHDYNIKAVYEPVYRPYQDYARCPNAID